MTYLKKLLGLDAPDNGRGWAVIRVAPLTGFRADEDRTAFAGWFYHRQEAVATYDCWKRDYPKHIVSLIGAERNRWQDGTETRYDEMPPVVRKRERVLASRQQVMMKRGRPRRDD